jgi:putative phage-type endonuclease
VTAVLIPAATEAEWLAARRTGITASEIGIVMGLSPYSSPFALYHQKAGDLPGQEDDLAMAIGRHFEDFVAARFAEQRPEFWASGDGRQLYRHPERRWQMATPDRILFERPPEWLGIPQSHLGTGLPDVCAVLECKTDEGFDGWGDDGTDEIPVHYRCQVLWQMDVMGVQAGFVACLFVSRRQLRVYEIGHGPGPCARPLTVNGVTRLLPPGDGGCPACADLRLMRREAVRFLERIDRGDPPDVDWRPATSAALRQLHPDVEDVDVAVRRRPVIAYQAACKAFDAAKERKRLAENRLRLLLGSGHRITDERTGEVIARRDVYDVKPHARKGCRVDKLVQVKPRGK